MSPEHKAALAEGRRQSHAVRRYLEALESNKPKRGRKRTPESINKRLTTIAAAWSDAGPVERLDMAQERMNLRANLDALESKVDLGQLEAEFAKVAAAYSARKGISYAAWREIGVSAATLKAAGIHRGSS
jgi:hypothetical protein